MKLNLWNNFDTLNSNRLSTQPGFMFQNFAHVSKNVEALEFLTMIAIEKHIN